MTYKRPYQEDWLREINIDNFAGGGGTACGFEIATGMPFDTAVNHDPVAIGMHKANHPETRHLIEDVWHVDPRRETNGRPVALAWFSPDCTHHSKARGGEAEKQKDSWPGVGNATLGRNGKAQGDHS